MRYLLAAALLPAAALLFFIWKMDKIEHEPPKLIFQLVGLGALTVISAMILETLGGWILGLFLPETSLLYIFLFYFIVVAGSEELGKFVVMKLRTWKSVEFNFTFDAVVYAVSASLGFAALENVMYVFTGGLGVAIMRALTSIPGHAVFGVFMGLHYGIARRAAAYGDEKTANRELRLAYIVPVLLHGFYDFCLSVDGGLWLLIFFAFYITLVIVAFLKVKKLSSEDGPVEPSVWNGRNWMQ